MTTSDGSPIGNGSIGTAECITALVSSKKANALIRDDVVCNRHATSKATTQGGTLEYMISETVVSYAGRNPRGVVYHWGGLNKWLMCDR